MSLHEVSSSLLTVRPRIRSNGEKLLISNSIFYRILCLFFYRHDVEIDFARAVTTIRKTYFWIASSSIRVRHQDISHLDYDYDETVTSFRFWGGNVEAHDGIDHFSVKLVTKQQDSHTLCTFRGEGSHMTGWQGVLTGDGMLDFSGTQGDESREFVVALCQRLDVPLGLQIDHSNQMLSCPECGRETSAIRSVCLYCGAKTRSGSTMAK